MRRLSAVLLLSSLFTAVHLSAAPPGDFYWADADYSVDCFDALSDTTELQNAFNAVAAAGGTLVLPEGGTCLYDEALTLSGDNWIIEGNGTTLALESGSTDGGLWIEDATRFEIRNLVLDGSDGTQGAAPHMLTLERSNDGLLLDVRTVGSTADGFRLQSTGTEPAGGVRTHTIEMIGCVAENSHGNGLTLLEADEVLVEGGGFHGSGNGASSGSGIWIESDGSDGIVSDVLIQGVSISGSAGVGIGITHASAADGGNVSNVRIVDADLKDDDGGALWIDAGTNVVVRGNEIHDYDSSDQLATLLVSEDAGDVQVIQNSFRDFTTGDPAIWIESSTAGPGLVEIRGNQLANINVETTINNTSTAAVVHDAPEGIVADNDFSDVGFRGILTRGVRSVIAGNTLHGMTENVILTNGADSVVINNFIGSLTDPSTDSSAGNAVIRVREPNNIVRGNSLLCANTLQRAIYLDEGAALVTNNTVDDCATGNQGDGIHVPSPYTILVFDNNVQY